MNWREDDPLLVIACDLCQAAVAMPCGFTLEGRPWVHGQRLFKLRFERVRRSGQVAFAATALKPDDEVLLEPLPS